MNTALSVGSATVRLRVFIFPMHTTDMSNIFFA
jgi:hypothetical protein